MEQASQRSGAVSIPGAVQEKQTWFLVKCFSNHGRDELTIEQDDLGGLIQP